MESAGYRYSFDMLGEAARTHARCRALSEAYSAAIARHRQAAARRGPIDGPGISVKLSALHPRYELAPARAGDGELVPRVLTLAAGGAADIGFTIDAEEADRLDLSLDLIEAVCGDPRCRAGTGSASRCRPIRSARCRDRLADWLARAQRRADGAPGQGRLLGQRDQAGAGARPARLSGLHPQDRDRRLLSGLRRASCWRTATRSIRSSPPTTRIRSAMCEMAAIGARFGIPAAAWHGRAAL